jgi:alkylhydroperoxidase/carboxymuconolactone decarboxylase family protein YurZ
MSAPTPDQLRARLGELRAARGFVLPHHGLMAAALPELHTAYEAMYRALTLDPRHLAPLARETVWLAILVACEEPVGTHHLRKFQQAGGTEAQALAIFRAAAWAAGAPRYATLDASWSGQFGTPMPDAYRDGARALLAPLDEPLARLALAAIQAANDQAWGLAVEIEAALACGAAEAQLAEALSYVIWPRGVNRFVRAAECWLGLIRAGRVPASPAFAAWAAMPDQGPLRL